MPGTSKPPGRPGVGGSEPKHGPERWLRPFFEESLLWPVLLVAAGIFVTLGAALLLLALRERNPFALLALLLLARMSAEAVLREHRRRGWGLLAGALAALWALSILLFGVAVALGLF